MPKLIALRTLMSSSGAFSMLRKNVRGAPGMKPWMSWYLGSALSRSTSWPGVSSIAFASPDSSAVTRAAGSSATMIVYLSR